MKRICAILAVLAVIMTCLAGCAGRSSELEPEADAAQAAADGEPAAPEQDAEEETNVLINGTQIFFQNTLDVTVKELYITCGDDWGERVNDAEIEPNGYVVLPISVLSDGPGTYSVGAIDENGKSYEIHGVPLDGRRLVGLSAVEDSAFIVLLDKNGETQTIIGTAFDTKE